MAGRRVDATLELALRGDAVLSNRIYQELSSAVSGSQDRTLKVWDLAQGLLLATQVGLRAPLPPLAPGQVWEG